MANASVEATATALGIHSPSRVYKDAIGKNIPKGVAKGVREGQTELNAEMKLSVNEALSAAKSASRRELFRYWKQPCFLEYPKHSAQQSQDHQKLYKKSLISRQVKFLRSTIQQRKIFKIRSVRQKIKKKKAKLKKQLEKVKEAECCRRKAIKNCGRKNGSSIQ